MDKVGRILTLFLQLYSGNGISKLSFSMENDITGRTFDRDIEDIRNFLAESYSGREVIFDRESNLYYMTGTTRGELTDVEFTTLLSVLIGTKALRKDEMEGMINQLYQMTERSKAISKKSLQDILHQYPTDVHSGTVMKMQWDLTKCIQNQKVVRIRYCRADSIETMTVIPCFIYYDNYSLVLKAINIENKDEVVTVDLFIEKIDSFRIIREQTVREKEMQSGKEDKSNEEN